MSASQTAMLTSLPAETGVLVGSWVITVPLSGESQSLVVVVAWPAGREPTLDGGRGVLGVWTGPPCRRPAAMATAERLRRRGDSEELQVLPGEICSLPVTDLFTDGERMPEQPRRVVEPPQAEFQAAELMTEQGWRGTGVRHLGGGQS